jgi:uncharacterized protein YdhG (YjbR/CyaY superfamily)
MWISNPGKGDTMKDSSASIATINEYIAEFPEDVQKKLQEMRATIKAAAPAAQEKISYQMPTFYLNGNLVHFAAYSSHIGFYPAPSGIEAFKHELAGYKNSKGAVQFPINEPLPLDLVTKIVKFRVEENLKKGGSKASTKKKS